MEASITLDGVTLTDPLIRWSPTEWPSVCPEIPVSTDKMFWSLISLQNERPILLLRNSERPCCRNSTVSNSTNLHPCQKYMCSHKTKSFFRRGLEPEKNPLYAPKTQEAGVKKWLMCDDYRGRIISTPVFYSEVQDPNIGSCYICPERFSKFSSRKMNEQCLKVSHHRLLW
jgi:hypothetical protein